jgi:hypothetical protein
MSCFSQGGQWFGTCGTTDAFAGDDDDDVAIAPGQTVEETLDARTAGQCIREIRVAIIYRDGSSEGIRHKILEMQASHHGKEMRPAADRNR